MSIDILHRYTKAVLFHCETAQTIAKAVEEALRVSANLANANLADADLANANLAGADFTGANLAGTNLSPSYKIAILCFGGWPVTVSPMETQIGCERHPNGAWLAWAADAPEIRAMHSDASAWWARHREAVCAVIRDVEAPEVTQP